MRRFCPNTMKVKIFKSYLQVETMDGNVIGAVTKKWSGCFREGFTDADVFSVTFPKDLDVKMKAILLGATFLIDFMEFEQAQRQRQH